jgi:Zn-finger nucleic acid-binding protein
MLIGEAELAGTFRELDGSTTELEARDLQPSRAICPRCTQPMQDCTLHTHTIELAGRFLRCTSDGVWIPRDALIAGYARTTRKARLGDGGGGGSRGGAAYGAWSSGSVGAAIAGIGAAFGSNAPSTLAISRRSSAGPSIHSVFLSAFRGKHLSCPNCRTELAFHGERWSCPGCSGCFVEDPALEAMVVEMTGAAWTLPAGRGKAGARPCPVCGNAMADEHLEAIAIARCHGHGVWFSDSELQQVLEHAAHPSGGVGAWLHRLFHRES